MNSDIGIVTHGIVSCWDWYVVIADVVSGFTYVWGLCPILYFVKNVLFPT